MLVVVLAMIGCSAPPADEEPAAGPESATIREARDRLGEPMVTLARAVIAAAEQLDEARHEVPRGAEMGAALAELAGVPAELREASDLAEEAAGEIDEAVEDAAGIVAQAAGAARDAADALEAEAAALAELAAVDGQMDEAVAEWERPGSQSERRAALAGLGARLDELGQAVDALSMVPEDCPALPAHRREWLDIVVERTSRLQETASGVAGGRYDELLESFRREPYGQDRRRRDAADRACWREHSHVRAAASEMPSAVEALEDALNP